MRPKQIQVNFNKMYLFGQFKSNIFTVISVKSDLLLLVVNLRIENTERRLVEIGEVYQLKFDNIKNC